MSRMKNLFFTFLLLMATLDVFAQANSAGLRVSFSDTVKKTSPAVVNIYTEKVVTQRTRHPFMDDPFFNHFFGGSLPGGLKKKLERSLGSGVIVTEDGYMISNHHVVGGAKSIKVVFNDGRELEAEVIASDKNTDIAILKIKLNENETLPYIQFSDSDTLEVGDVVLAIGNPYGVGQSVTMGIVSATGRNNIGNNGYENYIQTDAAINPGSSGGALVDSAGMLVGINTAIFSRNGGNQGIAFAIPANGVRVLLNSVLSTGKITRPWFGASGQDVTEELAMQLDLPIATGMLINEIVEGSPAAQANLQIGDIVLAFNGKDISSEKDLDLRIYSAYVGDTYPLKVWREGQEYAAQVKLGALPDRPLDKQYTPMGTHPLSGYTFEPLSPALNDEFGMHLNKKGIAVVELPASQRFGLVSLAKGDVIVSVNSASISTMRDLQRALSRRPKSWDIVIRRGNSTMKFKVQ